MPLFWRICSIDCVPLIILYLAKMSFVNSTFLHTHITHFYQFKYGHHNGFIQCIYRIKKKCIFMLKNIFTLQKENDLVPIKSGAEMCVIYFSRRFLSISHLYWDSWRKFKSIIISAIIWYEYAILTTFFKKFFDIRQIYMTKRVITFTYDSVQKLNVNYM